MEKKALSENDLIKKLEMLNFYEGWKSIMFLPYNFAWQCIVASTILLLCLVTTTQVSYETRRGSSFWIYVCDLFYLIDVSCATLHVFLKNTRKLRSHLPKNAFLFAVDYISLIPFEYIYLVFYLREIKHSDRIYVILRLNRLLRIYRFFMYFKRTSAMIHDLTVLSIITYIEMNTYILILSHVYTCIFHALKLPEELEKCDPRLWTCIFLDEFNTYMILVLNFIGSETTYATLPKRILCVIIMLNGYFLMYAFVLPNMIFSSVRRLRIFFQFWNRFQRLKIFVTNEVANKSLGKRLLRELKMIWTHGKGEYEPEVLKWLPPSLRKNIYLDLFWDSFRHSDLFRDISIGCKRSLALLMISKFYMPGSVFWLKGEDKECMIYLSSGTLQIMAEENSDAPVMSFSSGTVLGEASLFYLNNSKAILKFATFSEIHILYSKDLFRVLHNYPADKRIIQEKLCIRLEIAKTTLIRKTKISFQIFQTAGGSAAKSNSENIDSVKWLKTQSRILQEMNAISSRKGDDIKADVAFVEKSKYLKTSIDHTSYYISLLNFGEDVEVTTNATCLKTTFPCVIEPNSQFVTIWQFVNVFLALITSATYPFIIAWWNKVPRSLIDASLMVNIIYALDVFVQATTAIKQKGVVVVKSGELARLTLRRMTFYLDIIAAIPLQYVFRYFAVSSSHEKLDKVALAISLVKAYRIFEYLTTWTYEITAKVSCRTLVKYLVLNVLILYWTAAIFQVCDVDCAIYKCKPGGWYDEELESLYPAYKKLGSWFYAAKIVLDVATLRTHNQTYPSSLVALVIYIFSSFVFICWYSDFNATVLLESLYKSQFKTFERSTLNFMERRRTGYRTKKRVLGFLAFQWYYDGGNSVIQLSNMLQNAPPRLVEDIYRGTIYNSIIQDPLFYLENDKFVIELCKKSQILALPNDSVVISYGHQTTKLYVIYRGFVQINSYLHKDSLDGYASSLTYGPGKIFPSIAVFTQNPSVITARTASDCELVVIDLEDLLLLSINQGSFADFTSAIKETGLDDLKTGQLTLTKVERKKPKHSIWKKITNIASKIIFGVMVNAQGNRFWKWEGFRVVTVVICTVFWPLSSIIMGKHRTYLTHFLIALDCLFLIDIYVRLHMGYYTPLGILVSHPKKTAVRYLTRSFLRDIFGMIPLVYNIYAVLRNPYHIAPNNLFSLFSIMRVLTLYRIYCYFTYLEGMIKVISYLKVAKYLTIFAIVLNNFIVWKIRSEVEWELQPDGSLVVEIQQGGWIDSAGIDMVESAFHAYIVILYSLQMLMFRNFGIIKGFSEPELFWAILTPYVGFFFILLIQSFYTSQISAATVNFMVYQYHLRNLKNFMIKGYVDYSLSSSAIVHFEHEWLRKKGEDLQLHFNRFPAILHEELMYPIYRRTITGTDSLARANQSLHRYLSRVFQEVYVPKGSVIIFENEVVDNIYFVHKGQCAAVYEKKHVIITVGSLIGDIKGNGKMKTTIIAATHMILLSITSEQFFLILSNFDSTEQEFFEVIKSADDFLLSKFVVSEEDKKIVAEFLKPPPDEPPDSKLERLRIYMGGDSQVQPKTKKKRNSRHCFLTINPHSTLSRIFQILFGAIAILTAIIIPIHVALRLWVAQIYILIYALDALWILKIYFSFLVAYVEDETGHYITKKKAIAQRYLYRIDGFTPDLLSVMPFELLYLYLMENYNFPENPFRYLFYFRLVRVLLLWHRIKKVKKKLSMGSKSRFVAEVTKQVLMLHFAACMYLHFATHPSIQLKPNKTKFDREVLDVLVWAYFITLNIFNGYGFYVYPPKNIPQIMFFSLLSLLSTYERIILTNEIFSILNVRNHMTSEKLNKMQLLLNYLTVRGSTSALKSKVIDYTSALLDTYKYDVHPWFLQRLPHPMRVKIMRDLYIHHFGYCYLFEGLTQVFLEQLISKVELNVYFPKDIIVEKGDVDSNMYFIHDGEVTHIASDPDFKDLKYDVELFVKGGYFGLLQGMSRALPHDKTFRARTRVELISLNYFHWSDLRRAFQEETRVMYCRLAQKEGFSTNREEWENYVRCTAQPEVEQDCTFNNTEIG